MIADLLLHPLLTKMAITAMIVIATAVAAERAGPQLGGLIASLPVSAGPAYVFLALKSDDAFIATAALSSLYANAATGLFLLHLALVSARLSAVATFASGLVLWMAASAILRALPETLPLGIVLNIAVYGGAIVITRRMRFVATGNRAAKGLADLLLRALLVAGLVGTVVTVSDWIGPGMTGAVALFPMTFTSVGLLIHTRLGGAANAAAMASALVAMNGFTAALVVTHLAALPLGRAIALGLALCVSLGWAAALLAIRRRRAAGIPARP